MRTVQRPRRYVPERWLVLMRPFLRYSGSRQAFVLRVVGRQIGPVLRVDRRPSGARQGADRRPSGSQQFDGVERRRASVA
jgi:hypothetical protein